MNIFLYKTVFHWGKENRCHLDLSELPLIWKARTYGKKGAETMMTKLD